MKLDQEARQGAPRKYVDFPPIELACKIIVKYMLTMNYMFFGQIQRRNMSIFTTGNPAALLHKVTDTRVKILMLNNNKW